MVPDLFTEAEWKRWWESTKRLLKSSGAFSIPAKKTEPIQLRGEGISQPLARTHMFPPLASHLLTVGEETGKLDLMFARMAALYEEETRASIKRFTAIFEPVVILFMALVVGALVLSMMIAITSINDVAI